MSDLVPLFWAIPIGVAVALATYYFPRKMPWEK